MKTVLLVFSILFCFAFNVPAQKVSMPLKKARSDTYQVYTAVLKELFIEPKTRQIAIRIRTSGGHHSISKIMLRHNLLGLIKGNWSFEPEIVDDYMAVKQRPELLKDNFELQVPIVLLNEETFGETFNEIKAKYPKDEIDKKLNEVWKQRYKGVAYTVSNIGFNSSGNQALLHIEYDISGLYNDCMGIYVFLTKEQNSWIVRKRAVSWIS